MKLSKLKLFSIYILASLVFFSCKDDGGDPQPQTVDPIASFQIEYSDTDFKVVTFNNFSQNATAHSWDFGDGNTSAEESPTHTYAEAGEYEVVLTARNADGTVHTRTLTVTITDPNSAIKDLTGDTKKVWKLSRNTADEEFPFSVGPESRGEIWWAFGRDNPLAFRPCMMEEEYTFTAEGKFIYDSKGSVYADEGVWAGELVGACVDETNADNMRGVAGDNISSWGSGEHTFEYDVAAATLTLTGLGAHIGLPKVASTAEVTLPQGSVTYKVTKLETDGPIDKMQLETTFVTATGVAGYWQFNLVSYENPSDEPDLGAALPTAGFASTSDGNMVSFTNISANADSYMWDFGDGNTSTEESPTHTYMEDGRYNVVLTATNADGSSSASETIIIAINSSFSANALFGDESKTWKLAPIAGALKVGIGIGAGNFWASSADDVTGRTCAFDDTYTFTKEGVFEYNANGAIWGEPYMGIDPAGCIAENEVGTEAKAWTSATHSYAVTESSGEELTTLTVTGTGAFIALPKAFNGGEYSEERQAPPTADDSVTYEVVQYVNDDSAELLVLTIFIRDNPDGPVYWTFTLVSE